MNLQVYTKITGIDKFGNVIAEREEEQSHSLVQAFIAWLQGQMYGGGVALVKDTSNTNQTIFDPSGGVFLFGGTGGKAGAGVTTHGILVGSSTTAVAITDYNIGTLIAHGTGSGQLQYAAMVQDSNWTVSGSSSYFQLSRTLTNGSGGNITINELAFVVNIISTTNRFLFEHTLPTPYTVNNGTGAIIQYKWQASV